MKEAIEDLLAKKMQMSESDKAPKIEKINQYIEKNLSHYKYLLEEMKDDRKSDWEPLENVFIELVK